MTPADRKLLDEQNALLAEITREMNEYKFYLVADKLYHYAWHTLADVILEESKAVFASGDAAAILSRKQFLLHTLYTLLKVLHPFIPFVTEEIWSYLPENKKPLMIEKWPA